MAIEYSDFDNIDEPDLNLLVDSGRCEGLTLDFKQTNYSDQKDDKKEFLRDVSAFANSQGGDILIGVREDKGVATEICGVDLDNADLAVQRLNNLINDGTEPRLHGVRIRSIILTSKKYVIAVRVPRSWNPPHRVSAFGSDRFFVRDSIGVHPASVEEIRQLVIQGSLVRNLAKEFVQERLNLVGSNQGSIPIANDGRMFLHILPFASMQNELQIDPKDVFKNHRDFYPLGTESLTPIVNFDGFANLRGGQICHGYTQIFRSGCIEATKSSICQQEGESRFLVANKIIQDLSDRVSNYVKGLQRYGSFLPLVVSVALTGIHGLKLLTVKSNQRQLSTTECNRDTIRLPEIVILEMNELNDPSFALRPLFDCLFNTFGYYECTLLDESGKYIGDRTP